MAAEQDVDAPDAPHLSDVQVELQASGQVMGSCELFRLGVGKGVMPHFHEFVQYDIMHVGAGLVKDTVLGTLLGSRWSDNVRAIQDTEERVVGDAAGGERGGQRGGRGGRSASTSRGRGEQSRGRGRGRRRAQSSDAVGRNEAGVAPGSLSQEGLQEFEEALRRVAKLGGDFSRLERVMDVSKKSKSHTLFLLAGPCGLYALACVRRYLQPAIYATLVRLLQAIHLLWSKEVHEQAIPTLRAFVYEAVCSVELHLPVSKRDIKLHELTELASQILAWGECSHLFSCVLCEDVCVLGWAVCGYGVRLCCE